MGIINIGSRGTVNADVKEHVLGYKDRLHIRMGKRYLQFSSENFKGLAKLYLVCTIVHKA